MKKILEKLGVHNREEFRALFWQFFKFGLVGLSNTAVSLAVYCSSEFCDQQTLDVSEVAGRFAAAPDA